MNKFSFLFMLLILFFASCSKDSSSTSDYLGNWIELSDFEGVPRSDAVAFAIGNYGYIGTGYDGGDRLKDFWEYDLERDTWMQKADLPSSARNGASAFAANQKGYVCTGYDGNQKLKDLWEFDPLTNTWLQKTDFPGSGRYGAVAFSINDKGYFGSGYDGNYLKDFWQYDPLNDTWTQKVSIGGSKRRDAVAFVLNEKGYVCTGLDNGNYESDFWEYDPLLETWTKKRSIADATDESFDDDYSSIVGISKAAFVIDEYAYLVTGGTSASVVVWEWNSLTDLWELKTSFEGVNRTEAVAFTIGNRAFVTTGRNSSYYFDDIWEFKPFDEYNEYD